MADRNSYCTPLAITKRLPLVDLDPCSNPRSTVKARKALSLERGENGLLVSWRGLSIFCNPPYDNPLPWALKAIEAVGYGYLVNVDVSTKWYQVLTQWETYEFRFRKRIKFKAPPGVDSSQNNHSQSLICDSIFYEMCSFGPDLGQWWRKV